MIGASRLIQTTVKWARELIENSFRDTIQLVWPVSGVLRFTSSDIQALGRFLWSYRHCLEIHGLSASIGIVPLDPHYDAALRRIEQRVRARKDAKSGAAALPTLPFFAPCRIQPLLPANHWTELPYDETQPRDRRTLRSWQSLVREQLHYRQRREPLQDISFEGRTLPQDFDDFVLSDSDSYLAIIKADVDGLGRLFAKLFERDQPFAGLGRKLGCTAEQAGCRFSVALDECMREAVRHAFAAWLRTTQPGDPYPFLPLILAGDDLLIISQRHLALPMVCSLARQYETLTEQNDVIQKAFQVSGLTDERLTVSFGAAFVKKGFPFEAGSELAEELIRSAKKRRRALSHKEGCIDFHWYESTGRESLEELRKHQSAIDPATGVELRRYTRPWSWSELHNALDAAGRIERFPARKLHQLPDILQSGEQLSELFFDRWWLRLQKDERAAFAAAQEPTGWAHNSGWPLWRDVPSPGADPSARTIKENWFEELILLREILRDPRNPAPTPNPPVPANEVPHAS